MKYKKKRYVKIRYITQLVTWRKNHQVQRKNHKIGQKHEHTMKTIAQVMNENEK